MKRGLVLIFALGMAACALFTHAPSMPGVITLYAQALPAAVHVVWNPNQANNNIIKYKVVLDGGAPITTPITSCTPTLCSQVITLTSFGAHTATVAAVNLLISTDPTTEQTSAVSSTTAQLQPIGSAPAGTNFAP